MSDTSVYEQYDVKDLARLPTLAQGQAEDLRIEEGGVRWWLSRCGPEDGQDFPIGVEVCIRGRWTEVHRYGDWDEWHRHRDDDDVEDEDDADDEISKDGTVTLRLIEGPEGSPNFVYGTEDVATGDSVDYVQYDHGYPSLALKLGAELPDKDEVGYSAYLTAAHQWLEDHADEEFTVPADSGVIDN